MKQLNLKKLAKYVIFIKIKGHMKKTDRNLENWKILANATEFRFSGKIQTSDECTLFQKGREKIFIDYYTKEKYETVIDYIENVIKIKMPDIYKDLYE